MRIGTLLTVRVLLLASILLPAPARGQAPPSSASSTTAPASEQASSAPAAPTGFVEREELTGDWGGVRTRWQEKGFTLDSSLTQFFQGVSSGGTETGSEYNATAQAKMEFDLGKLAGWDFWSAELKTEWRFGGPLLGGTGAVNPVSVAAMIPTTDGSALSVTALNFTRLFPVDLEEGKLVALSFGRYNLLDAIDEDFFAGNGIDRFFNMAQIGPLTVLRQVPLITNAVNVAYIRGGQPFLTFSLLDPNDHSMDPGLSDLFADGVTFSPSIILPATYGGKSATHSFGGAITTKEYTPFDAIRQIIIPGPPLNPVEPQGGSWSINYVFRQYIVERAARDGWGLFTQLSFADRATSPITTFFDIGIGGNGLFAARLRDEFGVAYAYTDLSQELKDNLDLPALGLARLRAEHQIEVFYDVHIAPWLQLTGDLQIIRPIIPGTDTAVVPGGRLKIVF